MIQLLHLLHLLLRCCCCCCRQAALTALKELAAYPHLANGDYADVNREIKKIITKDSNIQVGHTGLWEGAAACSPQGHTWLAYTRT